MLKNWVLPFLFGAVTGVLSAWGVGGGTLLLLCMTLLLGVDQAEAQGINLLYFLPTALASLWFHRKNNCLDRSVIRAAVPIGTLCAILAVTISSRIDITALRKPFGLFLLISALLSLKNKGPAGSQNDRFRRFP